MTAPTLGHSRIPYARFVAFDSLGASIWAATYVGGGCLLGETLEPIVHRARLVAQFGGALLGGMLLAAVGVGVIRRRRHRRGADAVRISPHELYRRMRRGDAPCIVDLREPVKAEGDRLSLPGAVHLRPAELLARSASIPRDCDVVLVCDCPADAASIEVATRLQRMGFGRAMALEGGFDGWTRGGFPLAETRPWRAPGSASPVATLGR